jgi:hypothetical protein
MRCASRENRAASQGEMNHEIIVIFPSELNWVPPAKDKCPAGCWFPDPVAVSFEPRMARAYKTAPWSFYRRAKAHRLLTKLGKQIRPGDTFREAWIVVGFRNEARATLTCVDYEDVSTVAG